MCKCRPEVRTPFCGRPGCEWPEQIKRPCQHEEFFANVQVDRITDGEGGPVTHYYAHVTIKCARCQESFCFVGMERGLDPTKPMMSFLGEEARLPIRPSSEANKDLPPMPGFRIKRGA